MAASGSKTLPTIGFLTVIEDAEWGVTGGLLILNAAGRPLEFHCTAPLKPNRAQEILYGETLRPFLYGEQIGQTLLSKTRSETLFVCTDREPVMAMRDEVSTPVALLIDPPSSSRTTDESKQRTLRFDEAQKLNKPGYARLTEFTLGKQRLAVLAQFESDREAVVERWSKYEGHIDLREPFDRIREALHEAQRGAAK